MNIRHQPGTEEVTLTGTRVELEALRAKLDVFLEQMETGERTARETIEAMAWARGTFDPASSHLGCFVVQVTP